MANAFGRIVLLMCYCFRDFPSPVLLASVVTTLSGSAAKCAKYGLSYTIFLISMKSSYSLLLSFYSVVFLNSYFNGLTFSDSSGIDFAINCFAQGKDFHSLLDVGGFHCQMVLFFSLFDSIPCSFFFRAPVKLFLEEGIRLFSRSLCVRNFGVLFSNVNSFRRCFTLSSFVSIKITSSHTGVR